MKGKRVNNVTRNVRLKADESLKVTDQVVKELIGNYAPGDVVVYADFVVQNEKETLYQQLFLGKTKRNELSRSRHRSGYRAQRVWFPRNAAY